MKQFVGKFRVAHMVLLAPALMVLAIIRAEPASGLRSGSALAMTGFALGVGTLGAAGVSQRRSRRSARLLKENENTLQELTRLRESEERYRLMFKCHPHPMWMLELENLGFLQVNDAAVRQYGYSREEFLSMTLRDIKPPEDIPFLLANLANRRPGVDRIARTRHCTKDGRILAVDITCHYMEVDHRQTACVLAVDVTERERAQEELRASDERFRSLFELAPDAIYLHDLQGKFVDGNRAAEEMVGYSRHELIGKSFLTLDLLAPDSIRKAGLALERSVQGQAAGPEEFVLNRKDGRQVPVEIRSFPVKIQDQVLVLGVARDLTERKRAEAALRSSKDNLTTIFNSVNVAIFIHQSDGTILAVNEQTLHLYNISREQALTLSLAEDYSDSSNPLDTLPSIWTQVMAGETYATEWMARRPGDGSVFPVEIFFRRITWDGQGAIMAAVYDLTEKKQLQKQLLRAQRLESIGTLAAGIAHDLNNILTPIMISAQLLETAEPGREASELNSAIQASAQRGAEIVKQVLTYARGVEGQRVVIQPRYLIKDMQKIVGETFPKDIEFHAVVPSDLWTVLGDTTQLHQILMNLCVNARDAMPEGGILRLSAENVCVSEEGAGLFGGGHPGPHVLIQVSDTGHGIAPEIMDKIFDPFFTTKEIGKGTGLGLSTVLGIVRSHRGFIEVHTKVGRGSTFKVFLPANPGETVFRSDHSATPATTGIGEWILVVEDEVRLLAVLQRALARHNYQVVPAKNGQEGLELLQQHGPRLKAVITDVMMPVMDGITFTQHLKRLFPRLPVIACTGLGQDGLQAKLKSAGVHHFLEKPYSPASLMAALQDCLSDPV